MNTFARELKKTKTLVSALSGLISSQQSIKHTSMMFQMSVCGKISLFCPNFPTVSPAEVWTNPKEVKWLNSKLSNSFSNK